MTINSYKDLNLFIYFVNKFHLLINLTPSIKTKFYKLQNQIFNRFRNFSVTNNISSSYYKYLYVDQLTNSIYCYTVTSSIISYITQLKTIDRNTPNASIFNSFFNYIGIIKYTKFEMKFAELLHLIKSKMFFKNIDNVTIRSLLSITSQNNKRSFRKNFNSIHNSSFNYFGTSFEQNMTHLYENHFNTMNFNDILKIIHSNNIDYNIVDAYNMDFIMVCYKRFIPSITSNISTKFIEYIFARWMKLSSKKIYFDKIAELTFIHYLLDFDTQTLTHLNTLKIIKMMPVNLLKKICNHIDLNGQTFLEYIIIKVTDPKIYNDNVKIESQILDLIKIVAFYTRSNLIRPIYFKQISIDYETHWGYIKILNDYINAIKLIKPSIHILNRVAFKNPKLFDFNLIVLIINNLLKINKFKFGYSTKKKRKFANINAIQFYNSKKQKGLIK
jgi:hypothetical protein